MATHLYIVVHSLLTCDVSFTTHIIVTDTIFYSEMYVATKTPRDKLREILKDFTLNTSLKALPMVVKRESCYLRAIWAGFITILVILTVYNVVQVMIAFVQYPVVTNIKKGYIFGLNHQDFYDVTVCNLDPISSLANVTGKNIPSVKAFRHHVMNITACHGCPEVERKQMLDVRSLLLTRQGYYQYIGYDNAVRLGHRKEAFIIDCTLQELQGMAWVNIPCEGNTVITPVITAAYFTCYTIHSKVFVNNQTILGYNLVLYLDNVYGKSTFEFSTMRAGELGVALLVHEPGTVPNFLVDIYELQPGTSVHLLTNVNVRKRLPHPYGTCVEDEGDDIPDRRFELCCGNCVTEAVINACGCQDVYTTWVQTGNDAHISFCEDASLPGDVLLNNTACMMEQRRQQWHRCSMLCHPSCHEATYENTMSQSTWPSVPPSQDFYQTFIQNRPYSHYFPSNLFMENLNMSDNNSVLTATYASMYIRNNFMKVNVRLANQKYDIVKDVPKTTFEGLFSALGGALNFWIGITVILIVEMIDLVVTIVIWMWKDRTRLAKDIPVHS